MIFFIDSSSQYVKMYLFKNETLTNTGGKAMKKIERIKRIIGIMLILTVSMHIVEEHTKKFNTASLNECISLSQQV